MKSSYADAVAKLIGDAIDILIAMRESDGDGAKRAISVVITELEKSLAYHEMFVLGLLRKRDE